MTTEFGEHLLTYAMHFFDNRIVSHFMPLNSLGVQITGALNPDDMQTCSIFVRMAAFAKCRQFQVSKY